MKVNLFRPLLLRELWHSLPSRRTCMPDLRMRRRRRKSARKVPELSRAVLSMVATVILRICREAARCTCLCMSRVRSSQWETCTFLVSPSISSTALVDSVRTLLIFPKRGRRRDQLLRCHRNRRHNHDQVRCDQRWPEKTRHGGRKVAHLHPWTGSTVSTRPTINISLASTLTSLADNFPLVV